jgi:Ca2+-binding EF-hand superfamily protein
MRFLALSILFFLPVVCFAQPPGGGMFGPGGGGRWGGGGGRGFDPNQLFNMMSNGKDVVSRADISNPRFQGMFDRFAEQAGVTNGQLTREQFVAAMQARMGQRGGQGGQQPQGNQPGAPADANNANSWVERSFRRLDQNGDGLLNYDELAGDETLRAERDRWDTNKDGFIDLTEYKAYAEARTQQRQTERGGISLEGVPMVLEEAPPAEEEEKKPVVYRAGKLPKELPGWFAQLDTDNDGQIGLYEWRAGGRSIEEFQQIDRNGDGFLTIEEVMRHNRNGKQSIAGGPPAGNFGRDAQAFNFGGGPGPRFGGVGGFSAGGSSDSNSSDGQGGGRRRGRGNGGNGRGGNGGFGGNRGSGRE